MPSGLETVHPGSFSDCPKLKSIYVSTNTTVAEKAVLNCPLAKIIRYNPTAQTKNTPVNKNNSGVSGAKKAGSTVTANPETKEPKKSSDYISNGKDCDIVDLIEHPFNLRSLDNMMFKKDFFSQMGKKHPSLKKDKHLGTYSYGTKYPIDITCLGKKIWLVEVFFDDLNSKKKEALRSIFYSFRLDDYSQNDFSVFVSTILSKLDKGNIMPSGKRSKTEESGAEEYKCDYKDRTVAVSIEKSEKQVTVFVIYKPFRF